MSATQRLIQRLLTEDTTHFSAVDLEYREIEHETVYNAVIDANNPSACMLLGRIYLEGAYGFNENYDRGLYLLQLSAQQENSIAQEELAHTYKRGCYGVEKDPLKMVYYYEEAIKNGNIECAYKLACIYLGGSHGVEKDIEKAIHYYLLVQENGDDHTRTMLNMSVRVQESVEMLCYSAKSAIQLEKQIKELEEKVEEQRKENIELKYRPNCQGYEEAKADFIQRLDYKKCT